MLSTLDLRNTWRDLSVHEQLSFSASTIPWGRNGWARKIKSTSKEGLGKERSETWIILRLSFGTVSLVFSASDSNALLSSRSHFSDKVSSFFNFFKSSRREVPILIVSCSAQVLGERDIHAFENFLQSSLWWLRGEAEWKDHEHNSLVRWITCKYCF